MSLNGLSYDIVCKWLKDCRIKDTLSTQIISILHLHYSKNCSVMGLELWGQWIQHVESVQIF